MIDPTPERVRENDPSKVAIVAFAPDALPPFALFANPDGEGWVMVNTRNWRGVNLAVPDEWREAVRVGLSEGIGRNVAVAEVLAALFEEASA